MIDALITWLLGQPSLTAMVGSRILPMRAPEQTAYPLLTIQQLSEVGLVTLAGPSGTERVRLQFNCGGRTYGDARRTADLLTLPIRLGGFLNGFSGTWGSVKVQSAVCRNAIDHETPPRDGNDTAKYFVMFDLIVWTERG